MDARITCHVMRFNGNSLMVTVRWYMKTTPPELSIHQVTADRIYIKF